MDSDRFLKWENALPQALISLKKTNKNRMIKMCASVHGKKIAQYKQLHTPVRRMELVLSLNWHGYFFIQDE